MNAAPRSSRVVMNRIEESAIASITWRFSSPGSPKTYSTSSFSRHSTSRRATVRLPCAASISRPGYPCGPAVTLAVWNSGGASASADGAPLRPAARVPATPIDRIIDVGRRAPSAGFSQGLELLVLDTPETVAAFWETTRDPEFGWEAETVAHGPTVLILPLPDPRRYLERYAQPDKIEFGMDEEANWPVRFWEIDAAMASMLIAPRRRRGRPRRMVLRHHLTASASCSIGSASRRISGRSGSSGSGYRAEDEEPSGSWMKRRRRPLDEQIHRNGW